MGGRGTKPVTVCTESEWKYLVQKARALCPAPTGWTLRLYRSRSLRDCLGDAEVNEKTRTVIIRVAHGLSYDHTLEVLIHELAHAYAWQHSPHVFATDHDVTWATIFVQLRVALVGAKYAQVYAALHDKP